MSFPICPFCANPFLVQSLPAPKRHHEPFSKGWCITRETQCTDSIPICWFSLLVDVWPVTDDTLQDRLGVQMNYSQFVNHSLKDDASQEKLSARIQSQFVDCPPLVDIGPVTDDTLQDKLGVQVNYSHISPVVAVSASMNPPPLADSCFVGRRKPCYGWIWNDDDEDFVYLTPAT